MKYSRLLFVGGGMLASVFAAFSAKKSDKPNIVFILCDDMGYGDLGCYGQKYIETPNIDRMASEGMRFTQAYSGSPVSAPSRACIMTGQHTGHGEVRGNKEYWRDSGEVRYGVNTDYAIVGQHPYDPNRVILPEIMKENGYTTGMFGKWAGGYEGSVSTPDKRGIDEFFGYICQFQAHLYYPNFLNRYSSRLGDTATIRVTLEENIKYPMWGVGYALRPQYSADLIHEAAIDWLDRQSGDKPFFGFFTYTLPHAELVQPEDSLLNYYRERLGETRVFNGSYGGRYNPVTHTHAQFAAMIARLDNYVGEILKKLKEKGLDENTIVIFSSDNGPHEEGGADPGFFGRDGKLKGIKRSCHEGGIRIPFIVRWPGHVPVAVNDHQLAFYDILPTFCDLIGVNHIERYGENRKDYFDGLSFKPTLLGKDKHQKNHEFLYWEFCETDQIAVRQGDWKLFVEKGKCHLYNLVDDIHEDCDLAAQYPDRVEDMKRIVFEQHVENPYFKSDYAPIKLMYLYIDLSEFLIDFILHIDKHLIEIVQDYHTWAYAILFMIIFCETGLVVTPFLPGDSLLFVAGAITALPGIPLEINILVLILFVAAVLGDSCNYAIGHFFGKKLFSNPNSKIFKQSHLEKTHAFFEKYGGKTIIIARFVPIVRTFAPFVGGMGKMHYYYFMMYNLIGGALWVAIFCYAGYFFGDLPFVQKNLKLLIVAIIFVSLLPAVIEFVRAKMKFRKVDQ